MSIFSKSSLDGQRDQGEDRAAKSSILRKKQGRGKEEEN